MDKPTYTGLNIKIHEEVSIGIHLNSYNYQLIKTRQRTMSKTMTWNIEHNTNKPHITSYDIPQTLIISKGIALSSLNHQVTCETNQEDAINLKWVLNTNKEGHTICLVNETNTLGQNRWSNYLDTNITNPYTTYIPILNIQSQTKVPIPTEIITQKLRNTPKIELYFLVQDIHLRQNLTTYKLIQDQAATVSLSSQKLSTYHTLHKKIDAHCDKSRTLRPSRKGDPDSDTQTKGNPGYRTNSKERPIEYTNTPPRTSTPLQTNTKPSVPPPNFSSPIHAPTYTYPRTYPNHHPLYPQYPYQLFYPQPPYNPYNPPPPTAQYNPYHPPPPTPHHNLHKQPLPENTKHEQKEHADKNAGKIHALIEIAKASDIPITDLCEDPSLDPTKNPKKVYIEDNHYINQNSQDPFHKLQEKHIYQQQQLKRFQNAQAMELHNTIQSKIREQEKQTVQKNQNQIKLGGPQISNMETQDCTGYNTDHTEPLNNNKKDEEEYQFNIPSILTRKPDNESDNSLKNNLNKKTSDNESDHSLKKGLNSSLMNKAVDKLGQSQSIDEATKDRIKLLQHLRNEHEQLLKNEHEQLSATSSDSSQSTPPANLNANNTTPKTTDNH